MKPSKIKLIAVSPERHATLKARAAKERLSLQQITERILAAGIKTKTEA